ncbi:MAG: hypothetical protein HOP29_08485 [Phycisphaerales bacterium]|nr:hypothetical protein [Phycisphaerales bacterium]
MLERIRSDTRWPGIVRVSNFRWALVGVCMGVATLSAPGQVLNETTKLLAFDAEIDDECGVSVALSRDTLVVGAWQDDHAAGTNAGSAISIALSNPNWTKVSDMNVLPGNDGWVVACDPVDVEAVDNGVLTIVDDNLPVDECVQYWNSFDIPPNGFTVELRFRVVWEQWDDNGISLVFDNADCWLAMLFREYGVVNQYPPYNALVSADLTDAFHILRVAFPSVGDTVQVWFDQVFVGTHGLNCHPPGMPDSHIMWGCASWGGKGKWEVDYLKYSVEGAFAGCDPGYYGPMCAECPGGASNPCNGNGTCDDGPTGTGQCACNSGFAGAACDQCAPDHYDYPACTFCLAVTTCSGNGTCNPVGGCDCDSGWVGSDCGTPACIANDECNDDDACTQDVCTAGSCNNPPRPFGDGNHDGMIDIFDILCVLDGFAGTFNPPCTLTNLDLTPCVGDGQIDIFDILAVLDGFAGVNGCACPAGP